MLPRFSSIRASLPASTTVREALEEARSQVERGGILLHGFKPTGWMPEQDTADLRMQPGLAANVRAHGGLPQTPSLRPLPLSATLSDIGLRGGDDVALGLVLDCSVIIPPLMFARWMLEHMFLLFILLPFLILFSAANVLQWVLSFSAFWRARLDDFFFLEEHRAGVASDVLQPDGSIDPLNPLNYGGRFQRPSAAPAPPPLRLCEQMGGSPEALAAAAFVMLHSASLSSAWVTSDWATCVRLGLSAMATRAMLLALAGPALPPPFLCSLAAALGADSDSALPAGLRGRSLFRRGLRACRCLLLLLSAALYAHCVASFAFAFWSMLWSMLGFSLWAAIRLAGWVMRLPLAAFRLVDRGLACWPVRWATAAATLQARAAAGATARVWDILACIQPSPRRFPPSTPQLLRDRWAQSSLPAASPVFVAQATTTTQARATAAEASQQAALQRHFSEALAARLAASAAAAAAAAGEDEARSGRA